MLYGCLYYATNTLTMLRFLGTTLPGSRTDVSGAVGADDGGGGTIAVLPYPHHAYTGVGTLELRTRVTFEVRSASLCLIWPHR